MSDPEYGIRERTGEVISQMSQFGESLKKIADEIEARLAMQERKDGPLDRLIRRGPIEIRMYGDHYSASWEPEPRKIEVNGETKTLNISTPHREDGTTPYQAAHQLINVLEQRKAWG